MLLTMILTLLLYLSLGAVAGLIAGLFGVGGGTIIVPALIYSFTNQGMTADILTHMAVGTSLALICVSSLSSTYAHHKNNFILWPVVKMLAPGLVLGAILGVYTVLNIEGQVLQWVIGSYLLICALQVGFNLMPTSHASLPKKSGLFLAGSFIGWASTIFGIGGGSITVPFLSYFGTKMKNAVATAAACGVPIAIAGAITNILGGLFNTTLNQGLPAWSVGYIYVPAFLGMAIMSAPFAKLGTVLAKKMSEKLLKRSFACFLAIIGSSLIVKSVGIV